MASRADVDRLVGANRDLRALVARDLTSFWSTLDLDAPTTARDALLDFVPKLTVQYGDIAATVAGDWYADLRAAAAAPGSFDPILADNVPTEVVQARTRYGAGHLFTDQPGETLKFLLSAAGTYALQPGRDTVIRSAGADPWKPRWARVPSGTTTCAFCLMLASRGPVYATAEKAGRMQKFHDDCDCVPTPIGAHDSLPEGYDPEALYVAYQGARSEAGSGATTSVLAVLRQQQGIH